MDDSPTFPTAEPYFYELRVGVTGHRKLQNSAGVKEAVRRLLDRLSDRLSPQSRTPLHWTAISPLALGADRIVAAEVLKRPSARLQALLPFDVDEYRKDFPDGEDRDEFEELLSAADSVDVATTPGKPPRSANEQTRQDWRNRGYLRAGRSVVDACEILIVIWDGQTARGTGGTAEVISYALDQGRMVLWINANDPSKEACRITEWQPGQAARIEKLPSTAKELSLGYHQLDAYQRDDRVTPAELSAASDDIFRSVAEQSRQIKIDPTAVNSLLNQILPEYLRADRLAVYYRQRYVRATAGLFLLSAIAVTVAVGQTLFFPKDVWIILFEILAMGLAIGLWVWSKRAAWHEKWIHDRYLAERLRMAAFGRLVKNVEVAASRAPAKTLPFYGGPNHWLLSTVEQVIARTYHSTKLDLKLAELKTIVVHFWLKEQHRYHSENSERKEAAAHRGHVAGIVLLTVTLLTAILHLAGVGHPAGDQHEGAHLESLIGRIDLWITFLAIVLPAWGAAVHAIITQLELERIAVRSDRMASVLGVLIERANEAETLDDLREVVVDSQVVMGTENHEWWIMLSFRQPVLPA